MVIMSLRGQKGFTLIELLITVAVLGIAMAIAVPGMKSLLNNQRMKTASFDLVTTVMFARSEAVKFGASTNADIAIKAPSDNLTTGWCVVYNLTAATPCAAAIFADGANCPTVAADCPGPEVMRINKAVSGVTYTWATSAGAIAFSRSGRLTTGAGKAAAPVKIQISDNDGYVGNRCVTIDVTGNATTKVGNC